MAHLFSQCVQNSVGEVETRFLVHYLLERPSSQLQRQIGDFPGGSLVRLILKPLRIQLGPFGHGPSPVVCLFGGPVPALACLALGFGKSLGRITPGFFNRGPALSDKPFRLSFRTVGAFRLLGDGFCPPVHVVFHSRVEIAPEQPDNDPQIEQLKAERDQPVHAGVT